MRNDSISYWGFVSNKKNILCMDSVGIINPLLTTSKIYGEDSHQGLLAELVFK